MYVALKVGDVQGVNDSRLFRKALLSEWRCG